KLNSHVCFVIPKLLGDAVMADGTPSFAAKSLPRRNPRHPPTDMPTVVPIALPETLLQPRLLQIDHNQMRPTLHLPFGSHNSIRLPSGSVIHAKRPKASSLTFSTVTPSPRSCASSRSKLATR